MQAYLEFVKELACATSCHPAEEVSINTAEAITGMKYPSYSDQRAVKQFWATYRAHIRIMEADAMAHILLQRGYILNPDVEGDEDEDDE